MSRIISSNHFCGPLGAVFGDPHLITFDGTRYTFNGKGEYSLVVSEAKHFVVQGRTEQLTDPQSGKFGIMAIIYIYIYLVFIETYIIYM